MKAVIFDIGNVLIRWDAHLAFLPDLGTREAVDAFFARIGFAEKNSRADGGARFADLAAEIDDPQDRALFLSYVANHGLSLPEAIEGSWALLAALRACGVPVHAITNWAAETWPFGMAAHPRLGTSFGVTVVSGIEGVMKPAPRVFQILCERAGLAPADCLFIDDSARNVAGAQAVGMDAVLFIDAATLERDLIERGLL